MKKYMADKKIMATKKHKTYQLESSEDFHKYLKRDDPNDLEMSIRTAGPHLSTLPDVHHINEIKPGKNPNRYPRKPKGSTEKPSLEHQLEPDIEESKPPLANIEDLDDEQPKHATQHFYIDDRRLEMTEKTNVHYRNTHGRVVDRSIDVVQRDDVQIEDDNNMKSKKKTVGNENQLILEISKPDMNTYQQKKNLAQGMMDLALLSANANQLRYVIESASTHPYHFPSITLISLSIVLQIAVGFGLIMNSRYNVKNDKHIHQADKINNMTVLGVFIITVVNVFTTSFSVATPTTIVPRAIQVGATQQNG